MNIIDIVLAVLCLWFAVSGVVHGLVRQLFAIGGLIAAHVAGISFYKPVTSMLKLSFQYSEVVGYLVVFVLVYVAFRLLGALIEGRIRASKLSATDRAAGLVAGLAKGALVSVLLVFLLVTLLPQDSRALRKSRAVPYAISAGYWLAELFPERLGEPFREKVRTVEKLRGNVFPFRK